MTSGIISKYFSKIPFWIEYPDDIDCVPDAVLAVPFVCNVLPIVWLTDSTLSIPELDEAFFNCLPAVKKGYETMYPETEWKGKIEVGKIVPYDREAEAGKCAMFYSGGVDSVQTLISHLDERPLLIPIWGSDVMADNTEGWNVLYKAISEASERFHLPAATIRSTFREFDNEGALDRDFHEKLQDGWWHGVKHGIGLLGHVAPLAYIYRLETVFIAASNTPEDINVRCASHPSIDNNIRFAECRVKHDGFEYSRQNKVHNIVQFKRDHEPVKLHVCWESQSGQNCCKCEKCYRTIAAILSEGDSPEVFGLDNYEETLNQMQETVLRRISANLCLQWIPIKQRIKENRDRLIQKEYWKSIKWIEQTDFEHPDKISLPLSIRLKQAKGIRGKLGEFGFYQFLHKAKASLREKIVR